MQIEDKSAPLDGFWRALVVDNKDPEKYGKIMVWLPDLMPEIPQDKGIWAYPANTSVGGGNSGTLNKGKFNPEQCLTPGKGSWVFVFFEGGQSNRPFFFAPIEIEESKVPAECQTGSNPQDKWVLFKSPQGRCIVISDDEDDCRVEITSKKRNMSDPPSGDSGSVFDIDGNMTTILLDERSGSEKILIKTYKGDYVNIIIEDGSLNIQMKGDIQIKNTGSTCIKSLGDINIKSGANVNIQSVGNINIKAGALLCAESVMDLNIKSGINLNSMAAATINNKSTGPINSDGAGINDMSGLAFPAMPSGSATDANPKGDR